MAIAVEMPKMSDTMEEGVLVAWLADEGDTVAAGDVIAQVETDKATMDLEVYDDGVLLKKVIDEGAAVPIGGLIAVLGDEGEDISGLLAGYTQHGDGTSKETAAPTPSGASASATAAEAARAEAAPVSGDEDGRLKASPLARKLAREHAVDLGQVQGSGPEGRIIKRDVEAAMAEGTPAPRPAPDTPSTPKKEPVRAPAMAPVPPAIEDDDLYESVRISQMRKTIARRLAQSKYTAPHFYLTVDVDMEQAIASRAHINEVTADQDGPKISFNDLITKACALALRQHPWVNASYLEEDGEIRQYKPIHVGVAVAIDEGLVTPVIRHADQKGLGEIAEETRKLATRARDRKLQPEEMSGSTFTTSNLGMFGIEEFTAIINPPNACILAIGSIRDVPVVREGEVVPGKRMKLTLSCDHRVVDGATGARFLDTVRGFLEEPLTMLL